MKATRHPLGRSHWRDSTARPNVEAILVVHSDDEPGREHIIGPIGCWCQYEIIGARTGVSG